MTKDHIWLGPPDTTGLAPIAVATKAKGHEWLWKNNELTIKQLKKHGKFQKRMREADRKKEWRF